MTRSAAYSQSGQYAKYGVDLNYFVECIVAYAQKEFPNAFVPPQFLRQLKKAQQFKKVTQEQRQQNRVDEYYSGSDDDQPASIDHLGSMASSLLQTQQNSLAKLDKEVATCKLNVENAIGAERYDKVCPLSQFYSVDFSQSRIGVKECFFNKRTIKVCVIYF